jgi:hypothetical protein
MLRLADRRAFRQLALYEAASKDDRFITIFPPQGTAEWQSLTVQVAEP